MAETSSKRISVLWQDKSLLLLNQRDLPLAYGYITCNTYLEVARAIKDMVVRGAPAIGVAAAYGFVLAALHFPATTTTELLKTLSAAKADLDAARPTAVNLTWATTRMLLVATQLVEHADLHDIPRILLEEAHEIAEDDVRINQRMAIFGSTLVKSGANILHHCNTGRLATVNYGTALGVIYRSHEEGKNVHVWVDETRPRLQGARLTAWELMEAKVPMTLIPDNAAGHLMYQGKIDIILFGADRVAANGDVANKIGTFNICMMGQLNNIPRYACVPVSTIDLSILSGNDIPIEERDDREVTEIDGVRIAPVGVKVYNPAFDVTPSKFLTGIITEAGVCYPPFEVSLRAAVVSELQRGDSDRETRLKEHIERIRNPEQKKIKFAES